MRKLVMVALLVLSFNSAYAVGFKTHNDITINALATYRVGFVWTSYQTLVEVFGQPVISEDPEVDVEWVIKFDDGEVATIYNWQNGKSYCSSGRPCEVPGGRMTENIIYWYIGGKSKTVAYKVHDVIGQDRMIRTLISYDRYEKLNLYQCVPKYWYEIVKTYKANFRGRDLYDLDYAIRELYDSHYDPQKEYPPSYWVKFMQLSDQYYSADSDMPKRHYYEPSLWWGFLDWARDECVQRMERVKIIDFQTEARVIRRIDNNHVVISMGGDQWVMRNNFYIAGDYVLIYGVGLNYTRQDGNYLPGDKIELFQLGNVRRIITRATNKITIKAIYDILDDHPDLSFISYDADKRYLVIQATDLSADDGSLFRTSLVYHKLCSLERGSITLFVISSDGFVGSVVNPMDVVWTARLVYFEGGPAPISDDAAEQQARICKKIHKAGITGLDNCDK